MKNIYSLFLALALAACVGSKAMPTITPALPPDPTMQAVFATLDYEDPPDPTMQAVFATLDYEDSQNITINSPDGRHLDRREIEGKCGFDPSRYSIQTYFTQVERGDPNSGVRVYVAFKINDETVNYLLTYKLGDETAEIQYRDGNIVCKVDLHE